MRKWSVALCLWFLVHNTAATCPVTEFLKKHETEFFSIVNARLSLRRLQRKGVISQDIESSIIAATNDEDAQEILFAHLLHHANAHTLLKYCEVIIAANGYPRMQSLGMKMKEDLQCMQEGWFCVLVCLSVCALTSLSVCAHMDVYCMYMCVLVLVCVLFCNICCLYFCIIYCFKFCIHAHII